MMMKGETSMRRQLFCYSIFIVCEFMMFQIIEGQELLPRQQASNAVRQEIQGALLAQEDDARHVAIEAYFTRQGGLLATESEVLSIVTIGFDIPGFAKKGEKLWEIRFTDMGSNGVQRLLRAILYLHPNTSAIHAVVGPWTEILPFDLDALSQYHPSDEQQVKDIAFSAYLLRQHLNRRIEETATTAHSIALGITIPDFANRGDTIWEVCIDMSSQLQALVWMNPITNKTVFLLDSQSVQEKEPFIEINEK